MTAGKDRHIILMLDRLKNTWNAFTKATTLPTSITADTSDIDVSAWSIDVINSLRDDYRTLATPITDNPIVRAAIEAMTRHAPKATLQVGYQDDDGGFESIDHPLNYIWSSPSPGETETTLIEHLYSSMLECGNGYANYVGDRALEFGASDGRILEIQPIPTGWIQMPTMGASIGEIVMFPVKGWDYMRQFNFDVPGDRMLHVKTGRGSSCNGGTTVSSMAFGRTPLEAVIPELALIKLVSMYETTIISRAGVPSWIISLLGTASASISPEAITKLQSDFKRATSGQSVGRPFVHRGEMDLKTPGFSPRELSVVELSEIAVCRICGVTGWAPMTLMQPDTGKTYSNLIEANRASWRGAVIPFLERVAACLTQAVRTLPFGYDGISSQPDRRLSVRFDTSQIEELAEDRGKLVDGATKLYDAGIATKNEARAMVGLGELEDGEDGFKEDMTETDQTSDPESDAQDTQDMSEGGDDGSGDS